MHIKISKMNILVTLIIIIPFFSGIVQDLIYLIIFSYVVLLVLANNIIGRVNINIKQNITFSTLVISFVFMEYAILCIIVNGYYQGTLIRFVQLIICFFLLIYTAEYKWEQYEYNYIVLLIKIIVFLSLFVWPFTGFVTNYYSGIFASGNAMGGAILCYSGLILLVPFKKTISNMCLVVCSILLLYFSNSRTALLSLTIFLTLRFVLCVYKKIKYKHLLILGIMLFLLLPIIYMMAYNSEVKDLLNDFSWKYFRKRFFSGRQYIWGDLLYYISKKPLMGYGLHVTADTFLNSGLSSHNWYLQTILQIGIMGFSIIVSSLMTIWNYLYKNKNYISCRSVSAFMIAVLVWQCFEVSITQNNFSVGIIVWLVFGLGINKNFKEHICNNII